MREFGYSDEALRHLVRWDSFSTLLHRSVLRWLGHVARMDTKRLPKMAVFGWLAGLEEHGSGRNTFPMWSQWLLSKYGISTMDWFRLAQKPTRNWLKMVNTVLPRANLSVRQTLLVNAWRPGDPVQQGPTMNNNISTGASSRDPLQCLACPFKADSSRGLQVHYDSVHAIDDGVGKCPLCSQTFVFARDISRHRCPAKAQTLENLEKLQSLPSQALDLESLQGWDLYTDGSGMAEGRSFAGSGGGYLGQTLGIQRSGCGAFWSGVSVQK